MRLPSRVYCLTTIINICVLLVVFAGVSPLSAQQKVTIAGTPNALQDGSAQLVGHYNPQQMLRLVLALQPPHMADEEEFLRQLRDPNSPQFHKFLSENEWDARFAPAEQDEQAVVSWAQNQGLTITARYPNRLLVDLEAPVATIEKAFNVAINEYQVRTESHFSNDRDPSIPASLANVIHAVLGLNNIEVAHAFSRIKDLEQREIYPVYSPGPAYALGTHIQGGVTKEDSSSSTQSGNSALQRTSPLFSYDGYYEPGDISASFAYNYHPLRSLGHCCNPLNNPNNSPPESSIAIAIWGDFDDNDMIGWSFSEQLTFNIQRYQIDGEPPCCDPETTLDTEWTTAMANSFHLPSDTAEVHVYEGSNGHVSTLMDVLNRILTDRYTRVLSMSWGGAERYELQPGTMDGFHAIFNQLAGEGWSIVGAAGDRGATDNCSQVSVDYPGTDPNVTSAGGTYLSLIRMWPYGYIGEVTWSGGPQGCSRNDGGTGGGCSSYFPAPDYQGSAACPGQMRSVPDISLNADGLNAPQTLVFHGRTYGVGGTSISAPEMAGFYAQENAYLLYLQSIVGNTCGPWLSAPCAPMGSGNPYLYNEGLNQTAPHYPFYDITNGCNNNEITQRYGLSYYCAGPGYDRVTGWGSANMLQLAWTINDFLAGDGSGPSISISGPMLNHWYTTDETVSWTTSDVSGNGHPPNGVVGTTFAWDADPGDPYSELTPGSGSSYYGAQTTNSSGSMDLLSASQGCHVAYLRAWDNAGNSAVSSYGPVCCDTWPPYTNISLSGNMVRQSHYVGPVLVTLNATDNASGVAETFYSVDNIYSFQPYSAPFYVYVPGQHIVWAYSVDRAGNYEGYGSSYYFNIDEDQQFTLSVTRAGTGGGTVMSGDGLINCGSTCSANYWQGLPITLIASPASDSVFVGWRNCDQSYGLSCTLTLSDARTVSAIFNIPAPLQFVPVVPCRVVDTRGPNGPFGGPSLQGGTERDFTIPSGACPGIPSSAAAYSLNVTAVPYGSLNYLTTWPSGLTQPFTSTLNSYDGRVKANAAVVPAGDNAAVSVYVTHTTDVILDINGYFTPSGSSTLAFFRLQPCRVVDTRGPNGPIGGPYLQNQQVRDFPVLRATACHIPNAAQAYSMNITVVPRNGAPLGYLTVWPAGQLMPLVSTLNAPTGTVTPNAAIVPAGQGGEIEVYPYGADTDLIVDIDGYFAAPSSAPNPLSLYVLAPCRVLDTRQAGGAFSGELTVNVLSPCQVSSLAQAYVMNATVVPAGFLDYLTLWPDGGQQPYVSTLNAYDGAATSNMAIVPTTNGSIDAYAFNQTQLILDISSYFAP